MTTKPDTSNVGGGPGQPPNKTKLGDHLQNKAAGKENKNLTATKEKPENAMQEFFERHKRDFEMVVPAHIKPDRIIRLGISACRRQPKLLECHMPTIIGGLLEAASLGLEVNSALSEAYLVPFRNNDTKRIEAQLIIGYRGLVGLMLNHPKVETVFANAVHANDTFKYCYGINENLHHIEFDGVDRGEITHFYAYAKMTGGSHRFIVLSKATLDEHRDKYSQGYKHAKASGGESPWIDNYEPMGCKTAIRALERWIPKSAESSFHRAVDADYKVVDAFDSGNFDIPELGDASKPENI